MPRKAKKVVETPTEIRFPALFKKPDGRYVYEDYVANHGISGDTDSCYMKLPFVREDFSNEEVCDIADMIGSTVNDMFPEFIKDAFNVPDSRRDVMQTDREIVSDKSLFVTKKRYAAHVINSEGKWVDKMKIMGLEVRKSNTPVATKDYLGQVIDRLLDGWDAAQMKSLVREFKWDYEDRSVFEIATPMGCKKLKQSQDKFAETGSMKGFHYGVRAAMFYNSLCGPADPIIRPGDKIAVLYIKHAKSKYIAYPVDATRLPDFMNDIVVDYDVMWAKVKKTVMKYLEAMSFDPESQKRELRKKLFGFK